MTERDRINPVVTIAVACLATVMLMLDISVINTALSKIAHGLDTGLSGLQWVVDAYTIPLAATVLTAGAIADRFGRRKLFLLGLAIFTASSALCGAAERNRDAGGRASGPGSWGFDDVCDGAGSHLSGHAGCHVSHEGAGRVWCCDRRFVCARAVHRRIAHCAVRLAGDLPRQRADRGGRPVDHLPRCG